MGFPDSSDGKESSCNEGELGLIPGLARSTGERNYNPLQYSYLGDGTARGRGRAQTTAMGWGTEQESPREHTQMNRSTPGLPVHHQLPEFTQTHVHLSHNVLPLRTLWDF